MLTIDFETRSAADLVGNGVYVYAEDPTTDVLCLGVKKDDGPTRLWFSDLTQRVLGITNAELDDDTLVALIEDADEIHAHNANFEKMLWQYVMHKRYGFPPIPDCKWRCIAAKAAAMGLPRSLGQVGEALGLSEQKDDVGHKLMLKLCKPRAPRKAEREADPQWESHLFWHEDHAEWMRLFDYCRQDVEAERAIDLYLPDLSPSELAIWQMDQRINDRGILVDMDSIKAVQNTLEYHEEVLLGEVSRITKGEIASPRQVTVTQKWLSSRGVDLPDMTAETIAEALTRENIDCVSRRVLEIRQSLSKSSTAKYEAMRTCACRDMRVRGSLLYYGAATGRWSGRLIQPQNFPRGDLEGEDEYKAESALFALAFGSVEDCVAMFGDPMRAASAALRSVLIGKVPFVCGDFSQIEARVLAWLSGETKVLDAFTHGKDLYKVAATSVYKCAYEDVVKAQRQIGKTIILACGYQGGVNAFRAMASPEVAKMKDEEIKPIVNAWREDNPRIVAFWAGLELAAFNAVLTGKPYSYGPIKYGIRGRFLHCRLPSGRLLSYCDPKIEQIITPWGEPKDAVVFMGMNSETKKWCKKKTYGGLLTENVVQALSRDILAEAMLRIEKAGYGIVLTVHDEVLAEDPKGLGLEKFLGIMREVPSWANGLPMGVDGWTGTRYKK